MGLCELSDRYKNRIDLFHSVKKITLKVKHACSHKTSTRLISTTLSKGSIKSEIHKNISIIINILEAWEFYTWYFI